MEQGEKRASAKSPDPVSRLDAAASWKPWCNSLRWYPHTILWVSPVSVWFQLVHKIESSTLGTFKPLIKMDIITKVRSNISLNLTCTKSGWGLLPQNKDEGQILKIVKEEASVPHMEARHYIAKTAKAIYLVLNLLQLLQISSQFQALPRKVLTLSCI